MVMKIKEVSQLTGLSKKTIRFYEEEGLITPEKTYQNGRAYRCYTQADIQTLDEVALLRRARFSVEEIKTILSAPEEIPADYEYKFIDFVNPEILAVSEEEETAYEGCLSFPGHNGAVTRPEAVKVRAQDRNGNWFELEAEGLLARCIQHENDHLDGITIMQSSEYFYEDTEEGKKAAREAKGNK